MNLFKQIKKETLKKVKTKFSLKYHNYLNVFNKVKVDQLLFHQLYDHKIELINEDFSL